MGAIIFLNNEVKGEEMKSEFPIGTPTLHSDMANYREGYVSGYKIDPNWGDEVEVVGIDGEGVQSSSPSVIRRHVQAARHDAASPEQVAGLVISAHAHMKSRMEARQSAEAQRKVDEAAFAVELAKRIPAGFKGIVTAQHEVDDSDTQTDYFAHKTSRTVILGFTKTDRKLFGNMRKAAATWETTAHLAEPIKANEHRENYSMGGGMYLKAGNLGRHGTGWSIRIASVDYPPRNGEFRGGA
jgi:hypothetical protein